MAQAPHHERPLASDLATGLALCAGFAAFAWYTVNLHEGVAVAPIWPANSLLVIALLLLRRPVAVGSLLICFVVSLLINLSQPHIFPRSAALATANVVESVLAAGLARRVLGPALKLRTLASFVRLLVAAVLPASLCGAVLVGCAYWMIVGAGPGVALRWFAAHALGLGVVMSALLILIQPPIKGLRRSPWEYVALLGIQSATAIVMFHQHRIPIAFVVAPIMALTVFRLGPKGAAVGTFLTAAIGLPVVVAGTGPMQLIQGHWPLAARVHLFQVVLALTFVVSLLAAFAVSGQARLRTLLIRRQQIGQTARRRAVEASRAKTEFLATMSHEIRTPMNSILGFTQLLLRREDLGPDVRRQLELIESAGGSLLAVVNDILDFSKVEAGSVTLDPRPTDLARLGLDIVEIVRGDADAKGLNLVADLAAVEGATVMADDLRLRQVLLNLLNNAIKFTPAGQVTLSVKRQEQTFTFQVSDTGIGIAADLLPRLFSRFSQADSSITRGYGGTGLGLAICKRLVELMGGSIDVDTRPGEGSIFWFQVNLPQAALLPPQRALAAAMRDAPGRVLLVDDHPMNRELGLRLLEALGCGVVAASGGREAVAAAAAERFDLILMDVHMPEVDGLAATRTIRAADPGAPPIVAMTADVLPEQVAACLDAGMVDHLPKPIDVRRLQAVLARWLCEHTEPVH